MKALLISILLTAGVAADMTAAARKFTVDSTPDGKANMVAYLPENPTGRAIVDCPGGGYSHLATQHEGHDWAQWFNDQGIAFFVLTYRMPNGDRTIPMSDAQQAIRIVRDSAATWHINPYDVGIMGFSAGGHLASTVATHSEYDCRPNFSILFYPVISMNEKETHKGSCVNFLGAEGQKNERLVKAFSNYNAVSSHLTPPAIILTASDDKAVPVLTNSIPYYTATASDSVAPGPTTTRCSTTCPCGSRRCRRLVRMPFAWPASATASPMVLASTCRNNTPIQPNSANCWAKTIK